MKNKLTPMQESAIDLMRSRRRNGEKKKAARRVKTRERILKAGLKLWPDVTPSTVAKLTGISQPNVFYYFPQDLRDAVAEYAVAVGNSRVIVQLVAQGHDAVQKLGREELRRHFAPYNSKKR